MTRVRTLDEHGPLKTNVEDLVGLLGKPYTVAILYVIGEVVRPPARFKDVQDHLQVSPTTLSQRLKELVEVGLLERTLYDENPPRVEYRPSENMRDLIPAMQALHEWCRTHELAPRGSSPPATGDGATSATNPDPP